MPVAHQRAEIGELVIGPPTEKAHAHGDRAGHAEQQLVEVGTVLLVHGVEHAGREARPIRVRQRVHVADHRQRHVAGRECRRRAAVGRDEVRRLGERRRKVARPQRAAAQQRQPAGALDQPRRRGGALPCPFHFGRKTTFSPLNDTFIFPVPFPSANQCVVTLEARATSERARRWLDRTRY